VASSIETVLSDIAGYRGDWQRALEHAERAVRIAPTPYDRALAHAQRGAARCHLGQVAAGLPEIRAVVASLEAAGAVFAYWTVLLAQCYLEAGQATGARDTLRALLDAVPAAKHPRYAMHAHRNLGDAHRQRHIDSRSERVGLCSNAIATSGTRSPMV
jgi:tetratricopeptide (TPR) repeat protein